MLRGLKIVCALALAAVLVLVGKEFVRDPGSDQPSVPVADAAAQVTQGAYLARAGDCMACHTVRGGQEYAGGRAIETPFGQIYAPNITPDRETGIGEWSADDFWRALHNGKSRDGKFLYPAFPYVNYTKVSRADADALYAYFQTVAPVSQPNREHALRFPYNLRPLLAVWRALYFRPGEFQPEPGRPAEWNRGAYLVQGLGHCAACHTARNALGATSASAELGGAIMPVLGWHASPLAADAGGELAQWSRQELADLLKTGVSARGAVYGPMAEVVRQSLQYLSDADIHAMVSYLQDLPAVPPARARRAGAGPEHQALLAQGAKLYDKYCVECHQADGSGAAPAYPPLAGNLSITATPPVNPIRMVLNGGFPPSTAGNPRPYGMPPYGQILNNEEVAAVVSYIRDAWHNEGSPVSVIEVGRYRQVPPD